MQHHANGAQQHQVNGAQNREQHPVGFSTAGTLMTRPSGFWGCMRPLDCGGPAAVFLRDVLPAPTGKGMTLLLSIINVLTGNSFGNSPCRTAVLLRCNRLSPVVSLSACILPQCESPAPITISAWRRIHDRQAGHLVPPSPHTLIDTPKSTLRITYAHCTLSLSLMARVRPRGF